MAASGGGGTHEPERWKSRSGFVLATAGSAVGLGNIWRFPSAAAENGGGAFVALFLLVIVLVGVPGLMAELSLGRRTGRNALDAFFSVRPRTWWAAAGALALLASFLVLSYYAVIAGWVLAYVFKALTGSLRGLDAPALRDTYADFVGHPWQPVVWQAAFLALTAAVVVGGVRRGIERWSRVLMPGLVVLLAILAVRVLLLEGAWEGLVWLFRPHWEDVSGRAVLRAMGQVFFSFGLGMGVMITYGSYLDRGEDIHRSTVYVAVADAGVALLAAAVVIPALFAFGLPVEGGAGLLFATLPAVLGGTAVGDVLIVAFFVMVTIAALTSAISLLEALVALAEQRLGVTRLAGSLGATAAVFVAGLPSALAHGPGGIIIAGRDFLTVVDTVASDVLLPLAGLLTALFVGWVWGVAPALAELRRGAGWFPERLWSLSVRLVIPATVGTILAAGLLGVH
ncbi:MAG TPA: sodium-dependent transporter [Candidatus Limnocylindria bacterium]|nr:sodium-dependent transporter [Candidatus Limnocylindria bacterium]